MKVTIICSDVRHPVYDYLVRWMTEHQGKHQITLLTSVNDIAEGGDILFLVSCSEIVHVKVRDKFRYTLVLHASDLPEGRGWSPHIWDILNGKDTLTLSLLNAEDGVDTGDIWKKVTIPLAGTELYHEINHQLFLAELELMSWACDFIDDSTPQRQPEQAGSYHRKRTPGDSELDVEASIKSQFNLLRVCDPDRFPAYLVVNGQRYTIHLEKVDDTELH